MKSTGCLVTFDGNLHLNLQIDVFETVVVISRFALVLAIGQLPDGFAQQSITMVEHAGKALPPFLKSKPLHRLDDQFATDFRRPQHRSKVTVHQVGHPRVQNEKLPQVLAGPALFNQP